MHELSRPDNPVVLVAECEVQGVRNLFHSCAATLVIPEVTKNPSRTGTALKDQVSIF